MLRIIKIALFLTLSIQNIILFSQSDTLNQKDSHGLKQGYWIVYGKDLPEKGYCDMCKVEEGYFKDDRKNGPWKIYHNDGITVRIKGNFINGRPSGYYELFYPNAIMKEFGTFVNGKQVGHFQRFYESGCLQMEKFYNLQGEYIDTNFTFYYPNCDTSISNLGNVELEFLIASDGTRITNRYWPDGSLKKGDTDTGNSKVNVGKEITDTSDCGISGGGPDARSGSLKEGLNCEGYMKVYNKKGDLWMNGEFRDCKLWTGKLYIWDSNRVLIKIEIWRNGAYHSDMQL
jgi:antitoxin component YwqK of YwqJK toxin-antitoxin module